MSSAPPAPPRSVRSATHHRISFHEILHNNPFELAGMAELPEDPEILKQSLFRLRTWLCTSGSLNDEQLAETLFVLIKVAQEDYDDGTFWPHLGKRLGLTLDQPRQSKLGEWFRIGLKLCGYYVPDRACGLPYLTPILIHAGIPRSSLPGLVQFIAHVLHEQGDEFIWQAGNDPTLIAEVTDAYTGPLQRNVQRLFTSRLRGAAELWMAIALVVSAKSDPIGLDEAIRQLPAALDPEAVRDAVRERGGDEFTAPVRSRIPCLKYDPRTGAVFLWLPGGEPADWSIEPAGMRLAWEPGKDGMVGEFLIPLPESVVLKPRRGIEGLTRTFVTRPGHWDGIWFDARTGVLEQGTVIDRSGLDPATWYVLFEGTPDRPGTARRLPLNWTFSEAAKAWTAWEVEVPARSQDRTEFCWTVGTNRFCVPLGRRPSAVVRLADNPTVVAATGARARLPVFATAPRILLDRDHAMRVRLNRIGGVVTTESWIDLLPDRPTEIPTRDGGIYEIRERTDAGRALLEFALLPGLSMSGPALGHDTEHTVLTFSADPDSGRLELEPGCDSASARRIATRTWEVTGSTVDPWIVMRWAWSVRGIPDLSFQIPVPGLRWRIKGLAHQGGRWTRELLIVDRKRLAESDAQLELQAPAGVEVSINGQPARLLDGPWGQHGLRSLTAYLGEAQVRIGCCGRDHDAVLITSRPILDCFNLEFDDKHVIASWRGLQVPSGMVLLAWDPLHPAERPVSIRLTEDQLRDPGEWDGTWDDLPNAEFVALTIAAPHAATGFGLAPYYVPAADRVAPGRPLCRLIYRQSTGKGALGEWARLAFELEEDLLSERFGANIELAQRLDQLQSMGRLPFEKVLEFAGQLERAPILRAAPKEWTRLTRRELLCCLGRPQMITAWVDHVNGVGIEDDGAGIGSLLRAGMNPGWIHPSLLVPMPDAQLDSLNYALRYFRDLWLIGTTQADAQGVSCPAAAEHEAFRELQANAARKVVNFHKCWDLPWPGLALPWWKGTVRTWDHLRKHRHEVFFKPTLAGFGLQTTERFQGELGLRKLNLEGFSNDGRRYALSWENELGRGWTVEWHHDRPRRLLFCCHPGTGPLDVTPWEAATLANLLGLKDRLIKWAGEERAPVPREGPISVHNVGVIGTVLKRDPISGPLHALVFDPPPIVTKRLFGTSLSVPTGTEVPEVARLAWGIAWLDRVAARDSKTMFGSGKYSAPSRDDILEVLASSLELWELLMVRCLALAEYVWWALYGRGLGMAAKFEVKVTEGHNSSDDEARSGG